MAQIPDFFGLDLGHDTFKMANIQYKGKSAEIEAIGVVDAHANDLDNITNENIEKIAAHIKQAHKKLKISSRNCVMSVPEVSVFSRLIKLPKVKEEEVAESIQWALKPLIPVALDQVNISFLQIDSIKENGQDFVNWYVVAAPKRLIDSLRSVAQKAELRLLAIETEALASARTIYFNYQDKNDVVIVDLGAESTNVILSRNGVVVFSQTTNTGSDAISKVIASDFGIDLAQAEQYKAGYGIDKTAGDGKIAKSIEPILNIIVSEISRTLTYFKERISDKKIEKIYLTGGGANLPKLDAYMSEKLGVSTVVANPVKNFKVNKNLQKKLASTNINSFGVALGLALKTT